MIEQIVDTEEEEILALSTAKSSSLSGGQVLIGVEFFKPEFKKVFESRILESKYKFTELQANDSLLKILL